MEAKFAWYEPAASPAIDVRFNKAMPNETRDSAPDELPSAEPGHARVSFVLLAVFASSWLLTADRAPLRVGAPLDFHIPATLHITPQISFRPPPAR